MARRLLLILPAVAALIVVWAVLMAGAPGQVVGVQVFGGPTRGQRSLSLLLRTLSSDGTRATPAADVALHVVARASSLQTSWQGKTDASGHAEATLDFVELPTSELELRIEATATGRLLAEGTPQLTPEAWRAGARREGGWLPGQSSGALHIRIAPADGAIAIPFATELVLEVEAPGAGATARASDVSGVEVRFELEGAELLEPAPGKATLTDAAGRARLRLRATEHAVTLRVSAGGDAAEKGEWYGALPVVPGALQAGLEGAELVVSSPIAREQAFVSLVSEQARLGGAVVPLAPDDSGGATGRVALAPSLLALLGSTRSWAVASSEYDKRSPAVVGWPLQREALEPTFTFDVGDRLLLDGMASLLESERQTRFERRRIAAALLGVVGIALCGSLAYEVRRRRSSRPAPAELVLEPRGWLTVAAIACVALGVGALVVFGLLAR